MAIRFGPQVLGAISGLAADRIDRRILLIIIQLARVVSSIVMGTLVLGGQIQFWHIVIISLLESLIGTFMMPAQSALTMDIVGETDITNASALQRISMTLSGIVGPSLVGALVNQIGIGPFFYFNAAVLALSTIPLLMIRGVSRKHTTGEKTILRDFIEGFKYTWNNKGVLGGQMVILITNLYMWPCLWTLLPIFARNALNVGAAGLGWLSAANRLGGFIATVSVAHLGDLKSKGRITFISSLIWGGAWILMAILGSYPLSLLCLLFSGIASSLTMMLSQILILINSSPEFRGRVLGIRTLTVFPQSPLSIVAGALAESTGISITVMVEGVLFIITMIITAKLLPTLIKEN
jgi:MFS family permease